MRLRIRRRPIPTRGRPVPKTENLNVAAAMLAVVYLVPGALKRLALQPLEVCAVGGTMAAALESAWSCYTSAHQVAGAVVAACILTGVWAAWALPVLAGSEPDPDRRLAFVALKCGALAVSATPVASVNAACRLVRHLGVLALAWGGVMAAGPMLEGADRPDMASVGRLTYAAVACGTLGLWLVSTVAVGPDRALECGAGVLLYSAPVAMQVLIGAPNTRGAPARARPKPATRPRSSR